jgi:aminoglycoside phosphotransferase (APT) family kinase protein
VPDLDPGELANRLRTAGVVDARPLSGGASSLTYAARMGERRVVVKVAPPGVPPEHNRDVLRQARLIRALGGTAVPVPEILHEDIGEPPEVPPLFVMSWVEGDSIEPLFDLGPPGATADVVSERLRDAARTMARLHRVDLDSLGLAHEPTSGPVDEVDRWCRTLETVDPALVPGWREVHEVLRATAPAPLPPVVVHGDFRLGNLLAAGSRISAVVDWEIWSVGDPRVDAGWFLINADPMTYRRATPLAGSLPSPDELVCLYEDTLGHPLPDLAWFEALSCFKSAATWSLIVKHNRRRSSPDPDLEAMEPALPTLLRRARERLASGAAPDPTT